MTDKQPAAMRLAEALKNPMRWHELTDQEADDAADELVRSYKENKTMSDASSQIIADNVRLQEVNKELLKPLQWFIEQMQDDSAIDMCKLITELEELTHAAINKAKG